MTDRELQPADSFQWIGVLRRCLIPLELKAVATLMASYGDSDGTRIRPGTARLSAITGKPERTLRRMIEQLLDLGLLERVANGGGPTRRAAEYRLTVPSDLLERVPMLCPDEVTPANNVRAVAADTEPVDNPDAAENSGHDSAGNGRSSTSPDEVTPATSEGNSGQIGTNSGQREPLTCGDSAPPDLPPTPTTTSPEVSTSPAAATRRRDPVDPRPVAPAARTPGPGQQTAIWPRAAPSPPGTNSARIAACRAAIRRSTA